MLDAQGCAAHRDHFLFRPLNLNTTIPYVLVGELGNRAWLLNPSPPAIAAAACTSDGHV